MLCKITFSSKKNIVLPISYNYILQGVLYKFINEESFADFLHNKGYLYNNRVYKLFSFSNILENPLQIDRDRKQFTFPKDINIYFSSVNNEFFQFVFNSIITMKDNIYLGTNTTIISRIEFINQVIGEKEIVAAMSPITVYSTLTSYENVKKTYYYNPAEKEFPNNIRKNLINKYHSFYDKLPDNDEFNVRPIDRYKERIVNYKNFIIKGYTGKFEIEGSKELMEMAFCTGLGSKNSQGFGNIIQLLSK